MMKRSFSYLAFAVLVIASVMLASCAPAATPAPTAVPATEAPPEPTAVPPTAVPEPEVGSAEHPIKVLFVPSVDANTIVAGGKVMSDALNKATGLTFEVSVPTSYSATIEEMCASPKDTIGFIPALGYVLANQLCGVDVSFAAVRYGSAVYWAQVLVARDSEFETLEDLDGKKWGLTDPGSTSGYLVPLAMFQAAGIEPSESIETGGHPQSVKAVYNGEVDFSTSFYTPWGPPEGVAEWEEGDDPDVPDDVLDACKVTEDGKSIDCGGYIIRDARANIREEAPDVIQKVRILTVSEGIPNDTLSFGPEFPAETRAKIEEALSAFAETEDFKTSIGSKDFYNWTGIASATDADYDFVRLMVEAAGITLESLGE
ncbi:MAG: phosphate/phosphite/phosphonate ABC transporter substrate-binding protein [Anaerolineaceae bacterium]